MRTLAVCICKIQRLTDQLRAIRQLSAADQRHSVRYIESTIPRPPESIISSPMLSSLA